MSIVRFATLCDKAECGKRSEEYTSWPTCRQCQDDVCKECQVPGSDTEDERNEALCKACDPACTTDCYCEHNCRCCMDSDCPRHGVDGPFAHQVFPMEVE